MRHKYTRQQIVEAIEYWKSLLNEHAIPATFGARLGSLNSRDIPSYMNDLAQGRGDKIDIHAYHDDYPNVVNRQVDVGKAVKNEPGVFAKAVHPDFSPVADLRNKIRAAQTLDKYQTGSLKNNGHSYEVDTDDHGQSWNLTDKGRAKAHKIAGDEPPENPLAGLDDDIPTTKQSKPDSNVAKQGDVPNVNKGGSLGKDAKPLEKVPLNPNSPQPKSAFGFSDKSSPEQSLPQTPSPSTAQSFDNGGGHGGFNDGGFDVPSPADVASDGITGAMEGVGDAIPAAPSVGDALGNVVSDGYKMGAFNEDDDEFEDDPMMNESIRMARRMARW